MTGFIYSDQAALFGEAQVIGFGDDAFMVREIPRDQANAIIVRNHYSKKFYSATVSHLGVYIDGELVGVLQYGRAMNPGSAGSIVEGATMADFFELNRMWLSDFAPRNSESKALSYSIKFVRRRYPSIKFIQSFSDERCGLFGTVYQAAGFTFHGEHTSPFWELDGEIYHNSILTDGRQAETPKGRKLAANVERAVRHDLRQFRYLKFLQPRFAKGCRHPARPYPKPDYAARLVDAPVPAGASEAQTLGAAPTSQVAA
jgi:adenine modification enzyme